MRAYSNQPSHEFIQQLRDAAIRAKAAPAVIDQIDALGCVDEKELEREEAQTKADELERDRDDLRDELKDLVNSAIDNLDEIPRAFMSALKMAASALERHGLPEMDVASIKRALEARP